MGKNCDEIDQAEIKAACEELLEANCLRDEKRFLLRLLERSGKQKNIFLDLFVSRKTEIPEGISGTISKAAEAMVRIIVQSTFSAKKKPLVGAAWYKKLDEELYDQWGYEKGIVQKVYKEDMRFLSSGVVDIVSAIKDWAKTHSKNLSSDADAMRRKVAEVIIRTKPPTVDDIDFFTRRFHVINQLLDYEDDVAFNKKSVYRISCSEKKRLTVYMLSLSDGAAKIIKEDIHHNHLADWKIISTPEHSWIIEPKVINLNLTGFESKGTSSLPLKPNKTAEWAIYKHCKENRFAILNVPNDALLTCNVVNPLASDYIFECGDKLNDVGIWRIDTA